MANTFQNITHINDTLFIILVILIIFCMLFYIYHNGNISQLIYYDTQMDTTNHFMDVITTAKSNAHEIIKKIENELPITTRIQTKEKFDTPDERRLLISDANNYDIQLNNLSTWLNTSYYGDNGILKNLKYQLTQANNYRTEKRDDLIKLLTNIYILAYLDSMYKNNAEVYKMYLKYRNPTENKYYQQYI